MSDGIKSWKDDIEHSHSFKIGERVRIGTERGKKKGPIGKVVGYQDSTGTVLVSFPQYEGPQTFFPTSLERCGSDKGLASVSESNKPFVFCAPEDLCRHGRSMDKPCVDCALDEEANPPTEEDTLIARLSELLRGVALGLKGDPGPLKIHDWSDLPALAKQIREERDENEGVFKIWRRRAEEAERKLAALLNEKG